VFEAVRAGAHGYLLKDVSEQELLDTLKTDFAAELLNDKEEKILRLITDGMSNRQIAAAMFLAAP
jgi:DNA-binding NarL/FixJ family response regulator